MTPTFYPSIRDWGSGPFQLILRTQGRPGSLLESIPHEVAALDPTVPISEIHTLVEEVNSSVAVERLTASLGVVFGIIAALLAAVGIYGLLAYLVSDRQREIGIRMALGARPRDIGKLIGQQSLAMVGAGIVLGLGIALIVGSEMRPLLYGIASTDVVSFTSATVFVLAVATVATAIPIIRGARIQLARSLHQD
jgi:putative ABC transport system permease protein